MDTKVIDEPRQSAIDAIKDCIYFIDEMGNWSGMSLKEKSYGKSAAEELLYLISQSREPPLIVLENFARRMNDAGRIENSSDLFFISMQIADYIITSLTT